MMEIYEPINTSYSLYFLIGMCLGGGLVSLVLVYHGLYRIAKYYLSKDLDKKQAIAEAERILKGG